MGQLKATREGWITERQAKYFIGKIAFISTPDTIGDDNGGDILGQFIKEEYRKHKKNNSKRAKSPRTSLMLMPSDPFVVQIKSSKDKKFLQNHVSEIVSQQLPFYIGVYSKVKDSIEIFSTLGLVAILNYTSPQLLFDGTRNGTLKIKSTFVDHIEPETIPVIKHSESKYEILLYSVCTLDASSHYNGIEAAKWRDDCSRYLQNLLSFRSNEFSFVLPNGSPVEFIGVGTYAYAMRKWMQASSVVSRLIRELNSRGICGQESSISFLQDLKVASQQVNELHAFMVTTPGFVDALSDEFAKSWIDFLQNDTL